MQERQTKQKQIIYEGLHTLNHPTATEVYAWVHKHYPTVSRATVFRVLGGFASSKQALELRFAGSEVRYDYNTHEHYHARCVRCGKVADVHSPLENGMKTAGVKACDGFEIDGCVVEFFGRCKDCQEENMA